MVALPDEQAVSHMVLVECQLGGAIGRGSVDSSAPEASLLSWTTCYHVRRGS
jgi:hypothetical protein